MSAIDQQGKPVKLGVAYQFVFGYPGPDITCLVAEAFNPDGTVDCYDVHFKFRRESVKPERLWRPLKHTWSAWPQDVDAVTKYCGAQALDLT